MDSIIQLYHCVLMLSLKENCKGQEIQCCITSDQTSTWLCHNHKLFPILSNAKRPSYSHRQRHGQASKMVWDPQDARFYGDSGMVPYTGSYLITFCYPTIELNDLRFHFSYFNLWIEGSSPTKLCANWGILQSYARNQPMPKWLS